MSVNTTFKITVEITNDLKYSGNIVDDLMVGIDYATRQVNINQHLDEISTQLAFWGAMWSEAKYEYAIADLQLRNNKSDNDIWLMQKKREASDKKENEV